MAKSNKKAAAERKRRAGRSGKAEDAGRDRPAAGASATTVRFGRRHTAFGVLFAIVLTLGLLEIGTRLLRPTLSYEDWRRASLRYVYNPDWHWSLRPGEYVAPQGNVVINAQGLRGPAIEPDKADGTLRVVCLGGSSTFNYGARAGRTWPLRLGERLTQQLGRPVEVVNGGTPGYSAYQSSKRFEHQFVDWDPDLVVIYHMWNDLKRFWMTDAQEVIDKWDVHGRFNEASTLLDPLPFLDGLCRASQFVTHLRFAWIRSLMDRNQVDDEGWIHPQLDKTITPEGVAFYRDNLERVARLCQERNIPFLIVDQPLLLHAGNNRFERSRIRLESTGLTPNRALQAVDLCYQVNGEVAAEFGTTTRVPMAGFPRDLYHFTDHVHLGETGLEAVAAFLTPAAAAALDGAR